jgi:hypothetical protein
MWVVSAPNEFGEVRTGFVIVITMPPLDVATTPSVVYGVVRERQRGACSPVIWR